MQHRDKCLDARFTVGGFLNSLDRLTNCYVLVGTEMFAASILAPNMQMDAQ